MDNIRMKDVYYYLQGNIREFLYNHIPFLVRKHIKEQFEHRTLDAERCYKNGTCISCGCVTPGLFFADKACSLSEYPTAVRERIAGKKVPCYGPMKNKKEWFKYKQRLNFKKDV